VCCWGEEVMSVFVYIFVLFVGLFVVVVGGSAVRFMHENWLKEQREENRSVVSHRD